jgi:hypothetical protein
MRKSPIRTFLRGRPKRLAAIGASVLLVTLSLAVPLESATASAPTPTPAPTAPPVHRALAMGTFPVSSYAAAGNQLPAGLTTALHRDLGVTGAEYLADAAAAAQAVKVVASLKSAGVHVLGSKINGTKLTVNVASAADSAIVASTGATALVGAPVLPDYSHVNFRSVTAPTTNTYGGEGYFFEDAAQAQAGTGAGFRCSIGFSGYSVTSATPEFATAGHCATIMATNALLVTQNAPTNNGGTSTITSTSLGNFVAGQYGGGMDYGIVGEGTSVVPQASLYTWGGGSGAPLASAPLPITGQIAAAVGAPLCKSGSTSGWTCGIVTDIDTSVEVSGQSVNSIIASTCLLPGDSGGGAVIGQNAAGIDSGSTFPTNSCTNPGGNTYDSVFFPMVSSGADSVAGQQGANWKLLTAPLVVFPTAGGSVAATDSMTGSFSNPVPGAQLSLFLDGSASAFAQIGASSSWSIPLSGIAQGAHTYSLSETLSGNQIANVTGSFNESVTSVPTVTSPSPGGTVYPTSVMTGTVSSPLAGSTVQLFLDGSTTAHSTVNASSGSWSIPLTGINPGQHNYAISVALGSVRGPSVSGSFVEATPPPTAFHIDSITGGVGSATVAGWATWIDQPSASVNMAIQVGNNWTAMTANTANTDSGQPAGTGTNHGFAATIPLAPGSYSICLWAGNSAGGSSSIGCQTVTVFATPPPPPTQSHIDSITGGVGAVSVAGWAVWPDKLTTSVNIAVQIGNSWTGLTANQTNNDSGQPAGAGTSHGFAGSISLAPGSYSVCVWAGTSGGSAASIGCQTVTVLPPPPLQSHIDSFVGNEGYFTVTGWAVWPDKPSSSVNMALQVDGSTWIGANANMSNTDLGQPAGTGTNHGFNFDINETPGNHTVCVWAGQSVGPAISIGCATVVVIMAHAT